MTRLCAEFETPLPIRAQNLKPSCALAVIINNTSSTGFLMSPVQQHTDEIVDLLDDLTGLVQGLRSDPRNDIAGLEALGRKVLRKIVGAASGLLRNAKTSPQERVEYHAKESGADLRANSAYCSTIATLQDYFDLHGERSWVEWAGRKLMPITAEGLEDEARLAAQIRKQAELLEAQRAQVEETKRRKEALKPVSAHATGIISVDQSTLLSRHPQLQGQGPSPSFSSVSLPPATPAMSDSGALEEDVEMNAPDDKSAVRGGAKRKAVEPDTTPKVKGTKKNSAFLRKLQEMTASAVPAKIKVYALLSDSYCVR